MHYFVAVVIPGCTSNVEAKVRKLMKDHEGPHWDWYQIGGRWTGTYSDYDPSKDPANWETCSICGGTGERRDAVARANGFQPGYCNGCSQSRGAGIPVGKRIKWPTQWTRRAEDVVPVKAALGKDVPYAIVTPDGEWHQAAEDWENYEKPTREEWEAKRVAAKAAWVERDAKAILERYPDHMLVVVDCHN